MKQNGLEIYMSIEFCGYMWFSVWLHHLPDYSARQ